MELFNVLKTTVQAKISPFLNKIKMWMTPSYVKNHILMRIRKFFVTLFDVRPKNEKDYYSIAGWLVSKRLALVLVICCVTCCIAYIWINKPVIGAQESPYQTYKYDALALKWKTDKVCILGKSGYKAYVGDVEAGVVSGTGTLYNPEGNVVYEGEFAANAYNGTGKRYHANTNLWYSGTFKDNEFHGNGELYRDSGTLLYRGEFLNGYMEGAGEFYNISEKLVYAGNFQRNQIKYQELLGKKTTEVSQMYTGIRRVYQSENTSCVIMPEIEAAYCVQSGEDTLDEEWTISTVYVLQNQLYIDGTLAEDMEDVITILGQPQYEGNSKISMTDAVVLNEANAESDSGEVLFGKAGLEIATVFEDVFTIESYNPNYLVYLYTFKKDDVIYTFFCREKGKDFSFYMIQV